MSPGIMNVEISACDRVIQYIISLMSIGRYGRLRIDISEKCLLLFSSESALFLYPKPFA
jgi:hypothetical protein